MGGKKAYNFIFPHTIELIALWNLEMAKLHTSLPIHFLVPWTFCSKPWLEVLGRAERASTEVAIPSLAVEGEQGTRRLFSPGYPWIITLVMWPVMLDPRNLPAPGTAFFSLSTVDFCELSVDEDRRNAYILITARGHFGWQETLAVSNPWFPPVW